MSDAEWDLVTLVHLKGAFACTKACWPLFRKQKFGRVLNTASAAGLYGNMGQANYSAAKSSLSVYTFGTLLIVYSGSCRVHQDSCAGGRKVQHSR
jgi:NAD(P)-dependent dehydrogenase (short-subunit alcohol dehydrogenase family)